MFLLRRWLLPSRKLLQVFRIWDFCLSGGRVEGGSRDAPGIVSRGASSPPAGSRSKVQREGWECFWTIVCCARSRFADSFGSWRMGSCSVAAVFLCPLRSPVVSHHSSPHAWRRGELWETSKDRYRVLSSRGSRSSDRGVRWDKRARSRSGSFRWPWPSFSLSLLFPLAVRGRERRGRSSSRLLFARVRSLRERWRSSDRYRSRRDRSRCARLWSFDRYRSHRQRARSPARWGDRSDC